MIRDRLIRWLGGHTVNEWQQLMDSKIAVLGTNVDLQKTIRELQALIPVSAVTPKKRGRPKKSEVAFWSYVGNTSEIEPKNKKDREDWQKDMQDNMK